MKKRITIVTLVFIGIFALGALAFPGITRETEAASHHEDILTVPAPAEAKAPPMPETPENDIRHMHNPETGEKAWLDLSNVSKGYIAVKCETNRKSRLILTKDGQQYIEQIPHTPGYTVYPLEMGDGAYHAEICMQISGTTHEPVLESTFDVAIEYPEFRYLIPNHMVNYNESSLVVLLAQELGRNAGTGQALIQTAFEWIEANIVYDEKLVPADQKGYIPDLDRVLTEKTGICSDYASLFAAILRINHIPCKIAYGMVDTADRQVYHAWNLVLADEGNWILCDTTYGVFLPEPDRPAVAATDHSYGTAARIY